MEIKQEDNGKKGKFFIEIDGHQEAEMTYTYAGPNKIIIDHTEVNDRYRGQSLGLKLVEAAVEYARKNGMKIMPLCPFAKKMFDRHKEYSDVLW